MRSLLLSYDSLIFHFQLLLLMDQFDKFKPIDPSNTLLHLCCTMFIICLVFLLKIFLFQNWLILNNVFFYFLHFCFTWTSEFEDNWWDPRKKICISSMVNRPAYLMPVALLGRFLVVTLSLWSPIWRVKLELNLSSLSSI